MIQIRKIGRGTYITIKGKEWRKEDLAKHIGIAPHTLQKRLDDQWSEEELMSPPKRTNKVKTVLFKGKWVTFKEIANMAQVDVSVIRGRYALGLRDDDLIKSKDEKSPPPKTVKVNGKTYTLHELSQEYHLPETLLIQRYYSGKRGNELIAPKREKRSKEDLMTIRGVTDSIERHAKKHQIDVHILLRRINEGWDEDVLLSPTGVRFGKDRISFRGQRYTARELSELLSIPYSTTNRWVRNQVNVEDMLDRREEKTKPS